MIKANFNTYASYVTDSLYQWDINQVLSVSGLNLTVAPEIHFSNSNMDRAIVRQATLDKLIVSVNIPNSLLQEALTIKAHIGIYEGNTFKVVELIEIPVIAKTRPSDYKIENTDEEIYSFEALKNDIANMVTLADYNANNSSVSASISKVNSDLTARIDNIIAHNNDTEGNTELVDIRLGSDNKTYASAGEAVRTQINYLKTDLDNLIRDGRATLNSFTKWVNGGLTNGAIVSSMGNRISTVTTLKFDIDIILTIANGFRMGIHMVSENGDFISDSAWKTTDYYIPKNTYFKIVIARVTETSDKADIFEFSSAVTMLDYNSYQIRDISDTLNGLDEYFTFTQFPGADPNNQVLYIDIRGGEFELSPSYYTSVNIGYTDGTEKHISDGVIANDIITFTVDKPIRYIRCYSQQPLTIHLKAKTRITVIEDAISKLEYPHKRAWLTSAHRGFVDSTLTENTLGAFYNAYLNGADMIEIDARLSSDGVLICNHDATVTGFNANGEAVTYTIAETLASDICSLVLCKNNKWGEQKVPTVEQVLNLAYNTGLIINIDMKNGYDSAEAIAKLVLKCGMRGRVIYAPNGSGIQTINKVLEYDSQARFIDSNINFTSEKLADLEDYRSKCYAYTSDISDETIASIRESGCMLALISLNASNFESAIKYNPDMCEYLHTSNFKEIESAYFENVKLY